MDNQQLRGILLKLQDRLSDDDRRRLHFFLGNDVPRRIRDDPSLGGTLSLMESLFDQDKINEQDFTFLIKAFEEIQCLDAAKVLQKHMKTIESSPKKESLESLTSIMPITLNQRFPDDEQDKMPLSNNFAIKPYNSIEKDKIIEQSNCIFDENNRMQINSANIIRDYQKVKPSIIVQKQLYNIKLMKNKYLLIFGVLNVVLMISLVAVITQIILLKSQSSLDELRCSHEKFKYNQTIQFMNEFHLKDNQTLQELTKKVKALEEELSITIGTTCGCDTWCKQRNSAYGVCGDGHTCICSQEPITKEYVGNGCTCDQWCKKHGHKNGGVCGDGYTCICTPSVS